jgi:hypothetical protein
MRGYFQFVHGAYGCFAPIRDGASDEYDEPSSELH